MKRFYGSIVVCLLAIRLASAQVTSAGVTLIFPNDGLIVGSNNVLLWAARTDPLTIDTRQIVFEASTDRQNFFPLPSREAPDFGLGSFTTSLDTTAFPIGSLFLRARFADQSTGPGVQVQVKRTPVPACSVSRLTSLNVAFDCSASSDDNGGIVSYQFDFGDGTTLVSNTPKVTHSYGKLGMYPFSLTVQDLVGFAETLDKQLVLVELAALQDQPSCECKSMTVRAAAGQMSVLGDQRRPTAPPPLASYAKAPLGKDDKYISINFEVSAQVDGSPAQCAEGQYAKGSVNGNGLKTACSKGLLSLAACNSNDNHSCDITQECIDRSGQKTGTFCSKDGKIDVNVSLQCTVLGGRCVGTSNDGVCTVYPFAGATRGYDDYGKPFNRNDAYGLGVKEHGDKSITWLDQVGAPSLTQTDTNAMDFKYESDFVAFVNGSKGKKSCACHFSVVVDWKDKKFTDQTKFTGIADGETTMDTATTSKCTFNF